MCAVDRHIRGILQSRGCYLTGRVLHQTNCSDLFIILVLAMRWTLTNLSPSTAAIHEHFAAASRAQSTGIRGAPAQRYRCEYSVRLLVVPDSISYHTPRFLYPPIAGKGEHIGCGPSSSVWSGRSAHSMTFYPYTFQDTFLFLSFVYYMQSHLLSWRVTD